MAATADIIADFKARFPEFDSEIVDLRLPALIGVYSCYYSAEYAGCDKEAILNLLAHLLKTDDTGSAAGGGMVFPSGSITSESVSSNGFSTSYARNTNQSNTMNDFFMGTAYGQRFLVLTQSNSGGFFV